MAKKKKLDDLEAELAALEAELAALEGKAASAAAPKAKPKPAPAEEAPPAPEPETPAKPRFGLPKLKKGSDASDAEGEGGKRRFALPKLKKGDDAPTEAPADAPAQTPAAPAKPARPAPLPTGDLTHWRQEGRVWVRAVPGHEGPVVRRVLDEDDRVVREEPATRADLEEVTAVKAERGVGRLLSGAGGAAAGAVGKLKAIRFGRKGDKP